MNTREYTFHSLFGSPFEFEGQEITLTKIEIPIIQRDYAQGRTTDDVSRIRNKFLDALFQAITNDKHITLDFVYGDVSKDGILTPLDGQQRLTTLFLLHWYIAKKENVEEKEYEFLNQFSYATRFSSRYFCAELVKYVPDLSKNNLSDDIKDQPWYPYEWKNDPTIQSMLVMIDAIHTQFNNDKSLNEFNHKTVWKSLVNDKNVSFYFLPLTEMGLTDDLYIKMNSRGKPLTPFEHFKAEFEDIIKQHSKELSEEINHKFDINWTDMLFPFRGVNNIIDDEFMRYFRFISDILCYQSGINLERDEFKLAELLYGKENKKARENIEYLKNSYDCWCKIDDVVDFFDKFFSKNTYESGKVKLYQDDLNIFKECCDNYGDYSGRNRKFPLNKILLLFAINTYLLNKDKDTISENDFRRRIRIIRNLIWNSPDEIREERLPRLLAEIETVIKEGVIPASGKGELGFNDNQKEEERNKIEWLKVNPQVEEELFHLEDYTLLKGCIAVVGLDNSDNFKKFRLLFNKCDKNLINRALLSIGDFTQSISNRFFAGLRDNWFDLFHPSKQRSGFYEKTKEILAQLLFLFNEAEISDDKLKEIVNKYLINDDAIKDWRYYFVKYHKSLNSVGDGYYIWSKNVYGYDVIKLNKYQLNGYNWNLYLYLLWNEDGNNLLLEPYYNQGSKLKLENTDIEIDCLDGKYVVCQGEKTTEYLIQQLYGLDMEDRIEKGKSLISELLDIK